MSNVGIAFAPLVPAYIVWAGVAIAFAISFLLVLSRTRGAMVRSMALALFLLALANPSITREDREPLTSVAAVVIDRSASQEFGDRTKQADEASTELPQRLAKIPGLEVRFVEAGPNHRENPGTRAFLGTFPPPLGVAPGPGS